MPFGLLFSGQGAQQVGMGRALSEAVPAVRDLYEQADEVLGWSLREVSFEGPEEELTQTRVCQPALFVLGYAAAVALRGSGGENGPAPAAALGLSLGELTALAVAGVWDFPTGLRVVAERGRLMQLACDQNGGGMASLIGWEVGPVAALCEEFDIELANLNCPGQIVVSGAAEAVDAAVAAAVERGGRAIPLNVAGAYHSRLMEPARESFGRFLEGIPFAPPALPVFANTTGGPISDPEEIRAALVRQVVSTVRWEECLRAAAGLGLDAFFECGPRKVLAGHVRRIDRSWKVSPLCEPEDLPSRADGSAAAAEPIQ